MNTKDLSLLLNVEESWCTPLMEFVDGFRRQPSAELVAAPASTGSGRLDALVAATVEILCDEAGLEKPTWAQEAGPVQEPWLVSGVESLRGLAFAESPAPYRRRRIFVLGNFLSRA
jgi:hypothetical protein